MRTSGSGSVAGGWSEMRRAGATARAMLVAAAAAAWGVEPAACRTENGAVVHPPTGRRAEYGTLAAAAASLPVPEQVPLKDDAALSIVGRPRKRVDGPAIVRGEATYGFDLKVPGMLRAVVARPPVLGGRLVSVDDAEAMKVPGVRRVVRIERGVAVVAESTWSALKGREALRLAWDDGPGRDFDSDAFMRRALAAVRDGGGRTAVSVRDVDGAFASAARALEATYEYGWFVHAPMEPMNAIADVRADRCEIWAGTQAPNQVQEDVARRLGLDAGRVTVHVPLLGGGFGRRLGWEHVVEAVETSKAVGAPVQVIWTREDDMKAGLFQPASAHRLRAGLDASGLPVAWEHRMAGQHLTLVRYPDPDAPEGDFMWGAIDPPYPFGALRAEYTLLDSPAPTGPWRAVFYPPHCFARESFIDEIAAAVGKDPVAYRLSLLRRPGAGERAAEVLGRVARALEVAAERAGWGRPRPAGTGLGAAVNLYHGQTVTAQVAEVSVDAKRSVRVRRFVTAVDCGRVVNPLGLEGQVDSAVIWGLSQALGGAITFRQGRPQQSSYADYPVMTIDTTPELVTIPIEGGNAPTGIGEQPVAAVAAAVGNAVHAATGIRVRRLPIRPEHLA